MKFQKFCVSVHTQTWTMEPWLLNNHEIPSFWRNCLTSFATTLFVACPCTLYFHSTFLNIQSWVFLWKHRNYYHLLAAPICWDEFTLRFSLSSTSICPDASQHRIIPRNLTGYKKRHKSHLSIICFISIIAISATSSFITVIAFISHPRVFIIILVIFFLILIVLKPQKPAAGGLSCVLQRGHCWGSWNRLCPHTGSPDYKNPDYLYSKKHTVSFTSDQR